MLQAYILPAASALLAVPVIHATASRVARTMIFQRDHRRNTTGLPKRWINLVVYALCNETHYSMDELFKFLQMRLTLSNRHGCYGNVVWTRHKHTSNNHCLSRCLRDI